MNEIIISVLVFIILSLLSFIYYLFFWRKNLIKNTSIESENILVILNKKIYDQFKHVNKQIGKLEDRQEKHQKDILSRILSGTGDVEYIINVEFAKLKTTLDKFKYDTHNKVKNITSGLKSLNQSEQQIAEDNKLNLQKTDKCIRDNLLTQISDIKNQLDALQGYTLEKNQTIRRFEDGYDLKIQEEFVIDVINTIHYLEKRYKLNPSNELDTTIEDLNIMLENNSIHKIDIDCSNYRGQEKIAKIISTEPTNDPSKNYVIEEVLKSGYYLEINDKQKIIKPAEVVVYKMEEK